MKQFAIAHTHTHAKRISESTKNVETHGERERGEIQFVDSRCFFFRELMQVLHKYAAAAAAGFFFSIPIRALSE